MAITNDRINSGLFIIWDTRGESMMSRSMSGLLIISPIIDDGNAPGKPPGNGIGVGVVVVGGVVMGGVVVGTWGAVDWVPGPLSVGVAVDRTMCNMLPSRISASGAQPRDDMYIQQREKYTVRANSDKTGTAQVKEHDGSIHRYEIERTTGTPTIPAYPYM